MSNFLETAAQIRSILAEPDAVGRLPDLLPLLNDQTAQSYFFERLGDANWLGPLAAAGLFRFPPKVIRRQGGISIPPWPASRYLARMSNLAPEEVMNIILSIPETENPAVHRDFADAAASESMPSKHTAEWARREADWISHQKALYLGLPSKLGQVVKLLAQMGETDAAPALARALLDLLPEPRRTERTEDKSWAPKPEPRTRFDLWEYEQILKTILPALLAASVEQTIRMLADILEKALSLSRRPGESGREDYSYIWRPAIEASGENPSLGVKPILVTAVRDAAEALAAKDPQQAVSLLESYGKSWLVFQRVAMHILREFPDPSVVVQRLTNRTLFDEVGVRHEYVLLLSENFRKLKPEDQETVLGWIENGPNAPDLKGRLKEWLGREVTDADVEESKKAWQRERLAPIKKDLTGKWQSLYESLTQATGDPEHPEFPVYTTGGGFFSPVSPKTREELASMSADELAAYLRNPGIVAVDPIHGPTPAGLARELTSLVREEPKGFAAQLGKFHLEEPTFVRAIISGFADALTQGRELDWQGVLPYCAWAAQQQTSSPAAPPHPLQMLDRDPDWGGTRRTILQLLSTALDKDPCPIPFHLREMVWESLEPCTHDPNPSPEEEEKFLRGGISEEYKPEGLKVQNLDVLTYSINTGRGEAMQIVMRYARWVHQYLNKQPAEAGTPKQGLAAMPGVKKVLEDRLDPAYEPTAAIRSVYGRALPWLQEIDPDWTRQNVPRIFPTEQDQEVLWEAAWEAYLASWAASRKLYELLRSQYTRAVHRIGSWPETVKRIVDLDEHLARHLMVLNSLGALDAEPEVLAQFYDRANAELRGLAMNFVGWSLYQYKEPLKPEIMARLKTLWESRLRAAKAAPQVSDFAKEMAQFGWWFASGKFEDAWALSQLRLSLEISHQALPEHLVLQKLAELSNTAPLATVECLALFAEEESGATYLGPSAWGNDGTKIVGSALNSDDPRAREKATELADRLARLGHFQYIDLVEAATRSRPT